MVVCILAVVDYIQLNDIDCLVSGLRRVYQDR